MLQTLLIPFCLVPTQSEVTVPLESLDLKAMTAGYSEAHKNQSTDLHPLTIAGHVYAAGVGTHAVSEMSLRLFGAAKRFHAVVGIDDETEGRGSVVFMVFVDGKLKARSHVMRGKAPAETLDIDLTGARTMRLVVGDAGDGIGYDHADWAEATITVKDPSKMPRALVIPVEPPSRLAPVDLVHTRINGARVVGSTPGNPFVWRVPVSGRRPLKVSAKGLPPGLVLDAVRGVVSGSLQSEGTWKVRFTAKGPGGSDSRDVTIVGGQHKLALTPPMGWNSWNVWAGAVDAQKIRDAADSFNKVGLADFGYQYVNIDDCWEADRDSAGKIRPNEKFGDMGALAQYVHNSGLKLGIYSSPGPRTCAGFVASYQHELQDARTYAEWGIDYLKYDWCSYGEIDPRPTMNGMKRPYIVMREALDQAPRDIVYSLCQYGMGDVWNWGHKIGGNLWRTTGDINDSWDSMSNIGFSHDGRANGAGPGGWNDPDMLVVGRLGWGAHPHPTGLKPNEQITHITLWSLLAAPLIIGCDLTQIDDFTMRLLMNHDVIEVDQDPLGKAARRRSVDGDTEVWSRPLADGSEAVGLFNRGPERAKVTVHWKDLGRSGTQKVRNLWLMKNLGSYSGSYTVSVPAHRAALVKVSE